MTFASKRFGNRLKRFRALIVALNVSLFVTVAQAQQTSTTDKTQRTPVKPTQLPSQSSGQRRIQAVRGLLQSSSAPEAEGLMKELTELQQAIGPVEDKLK